MTDDMEIERLARKLCVADKRAPDGWYQVDVVDPLTGGLVRWYNWMDYTPEAEDIFFGANKS